VQGRLVAIEHQQPLRPERLQLAAQLGADRPAGSGHQHPLAGEVGGDRGAIGGDLTAAEQVGLGDPADVVDADPAAEQLGGGGEHLEVEVVVQAEGRQLPDECGVGAGDGQQQRLRTRPLDHRGKRGASAQDRHTPEAEVLLAQVVVDEADRPEGALGLADEAGDYLRSRLAGAVHQEGLGGLRRTPLALALEAPRVAGPGHGHQGEHRRGQGNAQRHQPGGDVQDGEEGTGDKDRAGERRHLLEAAEDPPPHVKPVGQAHQELHGDGQRHQHQHPPDRRPRDVEVVPEQQTEDEGGDPRRAVAHDVDEAPVQDQRRVQAPDLASQAPAAITPLETGTGRHLTDILMLSAHIVHMSGRAHA
jgi:hypothetical protein